jgi:hypothetical protein
VSQDLEAFTRALQEYTRYNRRELGPLLEARARKVQFELYRQFRSIAPTKEKINAEAEALGYRVRRRKGEDGKSVSLKTELTIRRKSIGWLSVSFLIREWKAQREGQNSSFSARSRKQAEIGKAVIRTSKATTDPSVRILSFLEGTAVQNSKRSLVDKALRAQTADMQTYIARKQREAFERQMSGLFNHLISV